MRKCPVCNSCLYKVIVINNLNYYCDFCKKYYDVNGIEKSEEEIYETLESTEKRQETTEAH